MFKPFAILFIVKLYTRNNILKKGKGIVRADTGKQ